MKVVEAAALALALAGTGLGCASWPTSIPHPSERIRSAEDLASRSGFARVAGAEISMADRAGFDPLPVTVWTRKGDATAIHVYVEGDGLAWRTRHRVSDDPTPLRATGLMLAAADPSDATIFYVGRPCQFDSRSDPRCESRIWTSARFGDEVVDSIDRRLAQLLDDSPDNRRLTLLGYSGGGVVAALVAARRDDVDLLVTVAAPLDVAFWTRVARVSPLSESLSPMDEIDDLEGIHQVHFVGSEDRVVPPATTRHFHDAVEPSGRSRMIEEALDHQAWPGKWKEIVERTGLFELDPLLRDP